MLQNEITSIAIANGHIMVREGLCSLISQFENFKIEVQANDGIELIQKLEKSAKLPHICILDINMPRKNGWDTLSEIKKDGPPLKCSFLTMLYDNDIVKNIVKYGANGYMPKNATAHDLKTSLLKLSEHDYYFPESIVKQVHESWQNGNKNHPNKKEMEFLSHCCDDSSYKEIAEKMLVSPRTVEGYRDSLFEKLKVKTRIGLAVYAIKNGFISLFDQ